MAKDLWQFTGVTYDNRLITVEEEIDRSFSRSDAERLCKSRNGFKEIRTSCPISRPPKTGVKNNKNNSRERDQYSNNQKSGSDDHSNKMEIVDIDEVDFPDDFSLTSTRILYQEGILPPSIAGILWDHAQIFVINILFVGIGQFFLTNILQVVYCLEFSYLGCIYGKEITRPLIPSMGAYEENQLESTFWFPGKKSIILYLYLLESNFDQSNEKEEIGKNFIDKLLISCIYKQNTSTKFLIHIFIISLFSILGYSFGNFLDSTPNYVKYLFHLYLPLALIPLALIKKIERFIKDYFFDTDPLRNALREQDKSIINENLITYNELLYESIYHISIYLDFLEGIKKTSTTKFFEEKIGIKIDDLSKIKTHLAELINSKNSIEFWKLIEQDRKINEHFNFSKKQYKEILQISVICIKKNLENYKNTKKEIKTFKKAKKRIKGLIKIIDDI